MAGVFLSMIHRRNRTDFLSKLEMNSWYYLRFRRQMTQCTVVARTNSPMFSMPVSLSASTKSSTATLIVSRPSEMPRFVRESRVLETMKF